MSLLHHCHMFLAVAAALALLPSVAQAWNYCARVWPPYVMIEGGSTTATTVPASSLSGYE